MKNRQNCEGSDKNCRSDNLHTRQSPQQKSPNIIAHKLSKKNEKYTHRSIKPSKTLTERTNTNFVDLDIRILMQRWKPDDLPRPIGCPLTSRIVFSPPIRSSGRTIVARFYVSSRFVLDDVSREKHPYEITHTHDRNRYPVQCIRSPLRPCLLYSDLFSV